MTTIRKALNYNNFEPMRQELLALRKFAKKFLDNFVDCEYCAGTGDGQLADTDCGICHGTGKHIESIGILYVELTAEAREILGKEETHVLDNPS